MHFVGSYAFLKLRPAHCRRAKRVRAWFCDVCVCSRAFMTAYVCAGFRIAPCKPVDFLCIRITYSWIFVRASAGVRSRIGACVRAGSRYAHFADFKCWCYRDYCAAVGWSDRMATSRLQQLRHSKKYAWPTVAMILHSTRQL